jgi:hypothetical protein
MLVWVHQFENLDLSPYPYLYLSLGHDLQNPLLM